METLQQLGARIRQESQAAYLSSPFSALSRDYFARFVRDPSVQPGSEEVIIEGSWRIILEPEAQPLTELMAGHLAEFLAQRMGVPIPVENARPGEACQAGGGVVVLADTGGGDPDVPESFTIHVKPGRVQVRGRDAAGLRDGVVRLVDRIGLRRAPILPPGEQVYRPRIRVRLGTVPWLGTHRDLVFMGFNAAFVGCERLATSAAIPELTQSLSPEGAAQVRAAAAEARRYGLRTYASTGGLKFPKDHPVFAAHPDARGALTWKEDGEYVLCTEHPLVKRFLSESMEGLFRFDPDLDGILIIVGGESFYHCFMRAYGVPKGHTNCPRCEALGPDRVVANLVNLLAEAARRANPNAEVLAWPYSAEHVWSADRVQAGVIRQLRPGAAIFTEIEKDEIVCKPGGVRKLLWDYSIDLIGPGERARQQIEECRAAGISIYMKSEPEISLEAPRLPYIPCMDRWLARAEAMAACGADGAFVFPAFRPCYGSTSAEAYKLMWWDPAPDAEQTLQDLAARLVGAAAGPHLRRAWRHVSEAMELMPEIPSYYKGPYYLGPAHPMCADPTAELPRVFYGHYFFMAEMTAADGLAERPTFETSPTGDVPVFADYYRRMAEALARAAAEIRSAEPLVPESHQLMFSAEASAIRWFAHTGRALANFYEACPLRDRLLALAGRESRTAEEREEACRLYARWREVLRDEQANAAEALPVMEADVRLDWHYGGDHSFPHGADMLRAKLEILGGEIGDFLPSLAARLGIPEPRG